MYLNKHEIAEKLNVSYSTVDRLMQKGMPYFKIGKLVRFDCDKVLEWIKEENDK